MYHIYHEKDVDQVLTEKNSEFFQQESNLIYLFFSVKFSVLLGFSDFMQSFFQNLYSFCIPVFFLDFFKSINLNGDFLTVLNILKSKMEIFCNV